MHDTPVVMRMRHPGSIIDPDLRHDKRRPAVVTLMLDAHQTHRVRAGRRVESVIVVAT
jgi:hypothetical protein